MRKFFLVFLVFVCMLALMASPSHAKDSQYRIGVVLKALDSDFWLSVKRGAEAADKKYDNAEVIILAADREINVQQQVQIVEDLITQGVNALCIAPSGSQELIPTFEKAYQAGIPVLLIDTDAPWDKKACFVGTDNYQGGTVAGSFISQSLNGKGKVALITGIMGHQTHMDRVKGAEDVFAKFPDIKIVAKQPANSERALGMQVMENILTSNPDLDAVFCTNDEMALGALQAAEAAGKKIIIVGFDANKDALESIIDNGLTATIAQNPFAMGLYGVENAIKLLNGEEIPKKIDTGTTLVTIDNAKEFLKQKEELSL